MARQCEAFQRNGRYKPQFSCTKDAGHTGPHRDRRTGVLWNHPSLPVGIKKPRGDS